MSGKFLTKSVMSTMAATDGLKDARSLRGKAAAQRKLRKAVGAWFDALEARQLLTAALQTTVLEDTTMVGLPPEIIADPTLTLQTAWGDGTTQGSVGNNPATGEITFTPNGNYNTPAGQKNKLFYRLSNGQQYTWEFQVLDVNDAPTFDMPGTKDAAEDSGITYEFGPIATDPSTASNSIVTNLGVGPSDEAGQSIVSVTARAQDSSYFEVQPTITEVYQKDGDGKDVLDKDGHKIFLGYKLSFKLAANKSGDAKVDVTVTDSGAIRDGRGDVNAATKTLTIKIADTNDPVQVGTIIVAPDATEDAKYTFELPTDAFTDIDPGENLAYTAQGLPSWLNFTYNSTSKKWEFTGTPSNAQVGSSTITVTAIDKGGTTASQTFTVTVVNVNDAPIVDPMVGLIDQEVTQNQDPTQWSYQIPAGLFYDEDAGDQLTYTVTRGDQALPDVLQYDAATRTLTLKRSPLNGDVGVYSLVVKATDSHGATTSSSAFRFTVKDVNDVPTVANPIPEQRAEEHNAFAYAFPTTTFSDIDAGEQATLRYEAFWVKDNAEVALPSWLAFDPATRRFSTVATSSGAVAGTYVIKVKATDARNASVATSFNIIISDRPDAPTSDPIPNQTAEEDKAIDIALDGYFHDADTVTGDYLTFNANVINLDGTVGTWPTWLTAIVDSRTAHLVGTPRNTDVGTITIRVTAHDTNTSSTTSRDFTLTVTNVNTAPTGHAIGNVPAGQQDASYTFEIPAGTITDPDAGDTLTYSAKQVVMVPDPEHAGQMKESLLNLPSWLTCNATTGTFTGKPANADVGDIKIRLIGTDAGGKSATVDFTLKVNNVDDQPKSTGISNQQINERSEYNFPAKDFVYDPDMLISDRLPAEEREAVSYQLFALDSANNEVPAPAWLTIDANGVLHGIPTNADVTNSLKLRVKCTDISTGKSASADYYLTITNVNDAPTVGIGIDPIATVVNRPFTYTLPELTFVDLDGDAMTISATLADGSPLPSWLSFDATTRTFSGTPNALADYSVKLTATDTHNASGSLVFTLRVTTENQAPIVVSPIADVARPEESNVDFTIPAGTFADPDAKDTLTYSASWTNTDNKWGWLNFDTATRRFYGAAPRDFAGSVEITVTARDNGSPQHEVSDKFILTIDNVNDLPTAPAMSDQTIDEEQQFNFTLPAFTDADLPNFDQLTLIAKQRVQVQVPDPKPDNPNATTWVWQDRDLPSWMVFNPGTMSLSGTAAKDYAGQMLIRITAYDRAGASAYSEFTFTVTNVNDAPNGGTIPDLTIREDAALSYALPTGVLTDPDKNDTVTYEIKRLVAQTASDGNTYYLEYDAPSWISVAVVDGQPKILGTPDDANIGTMRFRVWATDAAGLRTNADFNVTVVATNDAPVISNQPMAVDEGATDPVSIPGISVSDADAGTATLNMRLTITQGQWLEIGGEGVTINGTILTVNGKQLTISGNKSKTLYLLGSQQAINAALQFLKYKADGTFNGTEYIHVVVDDGGSTGEGGTKFTQKDVPLTVNAVNDAPVANNDSYASFNEDPTDAVILDVLVNDNTGPANESSQRLVISGVNPTNAHGTVMPFYDNVDKRWKLSYRPDANYYGPVSFTYTVRDDGSPSMQSNEATVSFTINAVNDAPQFTSGGNITVNEDDNTALQWATGVTPGLGEERDQTANFQVVVTEGADLFVEAPTIDATGKLSFKLVQDKSGVAKVTVRLFDSLGVSDGHDPVTSFTMTVVPVNDGPRYGNVILPSIQEDSDLSFRGTDLIASASDPEGNLPITLVPGSITVDSKYGTIEDAGNGMFVFHPKANFYGNAEINFKGQDGLGVQSDGIAKVFVNPVNDDAPAAIADSLEMDERQLSDSYTTIEVLKNDREQNPDGVDEALTIVSIGSASHGRVEIAESGQAVRYLPDRYYNGTDTFTYEVQDATGRKSTGTVTVVIKAVNTAPIAYGETKVTDEDTPLTIDVLANDENPDLTEAGVETLIIDAIQTAPTHGTVNIVTEMVNGKSVQKIVYTPNANYSGPDSFQYRISDRPAGDADRLFATATVNITVNPMPDDDTVIVNRDSVNNVFDVLANDGNASMGWNPTLVSITIGGTTYTLDELEHRRETDGSAKPILLAKEGKLKYNFDGRSFTYTPAPNYTGDEEVLTYTVNPGHGLADTTRLVTLKVNQLPTAKDDAFGVTSGALNVRANDLDTPDDIGNLKVIGVSQGQYGTVRLENGLVYYTPGSNFKGKDVFTYTIQDGNGATSTAQVTVTDTRVNNDSYVIDEDSGGNTLNVLANDYTLPGVTLGELTIKTQPLHGQVTIVDTANGKAIQYVPNKDYYNDPAHPDTFVYTLVPSSGGDPLEATVSVVVNNLNEPPIVADDNAGFDSASPIMEDSGANFIDVLRNDRDTDGGTLQVISVTNGTNGTVAISQDGRGVTYTPKANWNSWTSAGLTNYDYFTYQVSDGQGGVETATVKVMVTPVNDDPQAVNDAFTIGEDSGSNSLAVLGNDNASNPDKNETCIIVGKTDGAHGTVSITGSGGGLTYTPAANFFGTDTFTYTIKDSSNSGKVSTATVTVTVTNSNDAPVAREDQKTTNEDVELQIALSDLLANDTDADGDALSLVPEQTYSAAHGTVTYNKDTKIFTYKPAANYNGADAFSYTIRDGNGGVSTAQVKITVNSVNDAPTVLDDARYTKEDTALVISASDLLSNDTDVDGDRLIIEDSISQPSHGTVTFVNGRITYTPAPNYFSTAETVDSFTYTVSDGQGGRTTGKVTVTVTSENDAVVAVDDTAFAVNENSGNTTLDVLTNDNAANPDPGEVLTITRVILPAEMIGSVQLDNGKIIYTAPTANKSGVDTFQYEVQDPFGLKAIATVKVTVAAVNDNPVAADDTAKVKEDETLEITASDLAKNDYDEESRPDLTKDNTALVVTGVEATDATHGTVELVNGKIVFRPATNFNGLAQFKYTVSDPQGGSSKGTVTVTVEAVNDNPVAVNDAARTNEDTVLVINPATLVNGGENAVGKDTDADGDSLAVSEVSVPAGSQDLVELRNGMIYFTPKADFNGVTSFQYKISDGHGGTATGTVTVTVDAVNDAPVLQAINAGKTFSIKETEQVRFTASASDIEGNAITYSLVGEPTGAVIDPVTGVFTWTPSESQSGSYTFYVKATDNGTPNTYSTTQVKVDVADNPGPGPIAAPDSVAEGSKLEASYKGDATDKTFTWTVTKNGQAYTLPAGTATDKATLSFTPEDNGAYALSLVVKKAGVVVDTAQRTVNVTDVAPTIVLSGAASVNENATYGLNLGAISDPGAQDTILKYVINWGDGSSTETMGSPVNMTAFHVYKNSTPAAYITVTLVDKDGVHDNAGQIAVAVTNVAPTAIFTASTVVNEGSAGTVSFTNQLDGSPEDMAAGFSYQYDFNGDGVFETEVVRDATMTVPASYLTQGVNTVKGRIIDKDGAYRDYSATITVANGAPVVDLGADVAVGANAAFTRTLSFTDSSTGTFTATVDYGDGQGVQTLALNGKQFTLNHTYAATGVYTVKVVVSDGTLSGEDTLTVTVGTAQLQVKNVTATGSGFDIEFNMPIDLSKLNLFDGMQSKGRASDLVITGARTGALTGTAIWEAATNTLHFVKTGGMLAADSYTMTLFSRADGFVGLDGDADGNAGGNYVRSIAVAVESGPVMTLPDIARGPKQSFELPIRFDSATTTLGLTGELHFDPKLLNVTDIVLATGLPSDWTVTMNLVAPGQVKFTAYGTTALTAGAKQLLVVKANVPSDAPYGAAGMLKLVNVEADDVAVRCDSAVQAVAYLGDASGNKSYTGVDASYIANVSIKSVRGFDAYPLIDPVIIGDVSGNGSIGGLDASFVAQKSVGMARPEIPDLPAATLTDATAAKAIASPSTATVNKAKKTVTATKPTVQIQAKKVFANGQIRRASTSSMALIGKLAKKADSVFGGTTIESDILK